jgi:DNA-binding transcriptional LysR family regulator
LIATKIIDLTQIVCASPEYLARHGRPLVPSDLTKHHCLTLSSIAKPATWLFDGDDGPVTVDVTGPVSADSSDVLVRLAREGVGIVRLGELALARAIMSGALEPLLPDVQVQDGYPLWALLPPGRQRSPKVRVFLEFLAERLGRAPWRPSLGIVPKR